MKNDIPNSFLSKDEEIEYLKNENRKLREISEALIFRVEQGATNEAPYSSFERSVNLTVQVNQKTQELNEALSKLQRLNKSLTNANEAANIFKQRFIEAIESITDGFVLLDQNGTIIFQNSNFERFWKNSEFSPIEGATYSSLQTLGKLNGTILSITSDDDTQCSVYHLKNERWYQLKERKTQEGGLVLLFTDITHIKKAELQRFKIAIAEKNHVLQSLIDNLSQGVLLINEDGSPEVWNLQFEKFCGLNTKTIQEVNRLEDFAGITELSLLLDTNESVYIQELQNGVVIDVRRHFLADGKSIITLADITEQHQYEQSLKESEIWLRTITDNVPAMIAYVNNKKRFMFTNKVYNEWYGQESSELIGKALDKTHLVGEYNKLEVYISRALSGETVTFESREFSHDGTESYLLKSYVPNISEQGEVLGFFVLINNITERILAAQALQGANLELEERVHLRTLDLEQEVENRKTAQVKLSEAIQSAELANESKSKFLAAVSHDLLQPLNAAKLFAESLFHDFGVNELPILNSIKNSLNDLENLIVTLVDISKLDAGLVNPDKQIFPLNSLLENISRDYQKISKVHLIEFSFVPTSVYVESDSLLLARILRNYLSNAIKYAKGKKVTLGCRRRGSNIEVQVWDTGDGIAQENLHEIFKEFKRLKGTVHAQQSLGLGLAIVEKMSKVLEHTISVKSELGKGSCFSILLPIKKLDLSIESNQGQNDMLSNDISGARVWVVDNDLAICEAMRLLLTRWGCEVTVAASFDALNELVDPQYDDCDLLLVDYHLDNDQTGIMVAEQINRNRKIPIETIMVSANYKQELREQCKRNRILLLNKPVKPLKLKMLILQCVRNK